MRKFKRIIIILLIVLMDLAIFLFLGLLLMNYEDFYTEADGPWYSLESMDLMDKIIYFGYNFWILLNAIILIYLIIRFIKKKRPHNNMYSA